MNYGRFFEMRQSPQPQHRLGRYKTIATGTKIPIGAPVVVPTGAETDVDKRLPLELATGEQARPLIGMGGILIYEYAFNWERGVDPVVTNPSDFPDAPLDAPAQLVFGTECKFAYHNLEDWTFQGQQPYEGRIMVAGATGATPTVAVGDLLTPGVGNKDDGFWAVTATEANGWMVVTYIDEFTVEAQLLF